MVVPTGWETGCGASLASVICQPFSLSAVRLEMVRRETEEMLANASPRNPKLSIRISSSAFCNLLVAWAASARERSSGPIPWPSSRTRINATPPCSTSISILLADASIAFSSSSLTTEAGRSITSPAAIWLAMWVGSTRMG